MKRSGGDVDEAHERAARELADRRCVVVPEDYRSPDVVVAGLPGGGAAARVYAAVCGHEIRRAREVTRMTQTALADASWVSQSRLSNIERGRICPGPAEFRGIALAIGRPGGDLA